MTDQNAFTQRTDEDIDADIHQLIQSYPPLVKDRHAIHVAVENGVVTLTGHVQTSITRRYFLDNLAGIAGVDRIQADQFYDDETIRLEAGHVIPEGVKIARSQYGAVVLSGHLPPNTTLQQIEARVMQVPGVVRIIPSFAPQED